MTQLCFVAGDPSGDAHAAVLVHALRRRDPSFTFSGLGGPCMRAAGVALLDDLTQAASIGPFDAARHLRRFIQARRLLQEHLASTKPEAVILVDFGDFNLPVVAPLAKRAGCRVLYYISPQLWAWGRFRMRFVKRYVDRMLVLFPFEEAFYRRHNVPVTWVGHPLVEDRPAVRTREAALQETGLNPWRIAVGLLPGSREREVARHLPLMLAAARRIAWEMPGAQFLILKAPGVPRERYEAAMRKAGVDVTLTDRALGEIAPALDGAVVASGTATLQTALAGVPMVVTYRTSWPTYLAAKAVVRVPYIAMVNLLAEQEIAPELIQWRAIPSRIAAALVQILRSEPRRAAIRRQLQAVAERLGPPGAVERAAEAIVQAIQDPS